MLGSDVDLVSQFNNALIKKLPPYICSYHFCSQWGLIGPKHNESSNDGR